MSTQNINQISGAIIDAAIEVHRELGGPGLLNFGERLLKDGFTGS